MDLTTAYHALRIPPGSTPEAAKSAFDGMTQFLQADSAENLSELQQIALEEKRNYLQDALQTIATEHASRMERAQQFAKSDAEQSDHSQLSPAAQEALAKFGAASNREAQEREDSDRNNMNGISFNMWQWF